MKLLLNHLLASVFYIAHAWWDGPVIVVNAERHLLIYSAIKLYLAIHKLLAKNTAALVLPSLARVLLPTWSLIFVEHLHLLLEVLRLSLIQILLRLLLGLLDVLRQVIDALQLNDLLMWDLSHLLLLIAWLLLGGLQVDHLIVRDSNLLALVAHLLLAWKSWELHLLIQLILLFSFSLTLLRLILLARLSSRCLPLHLTIGGLVLVEILYLKLVSIRVRDYFNLDRARITSRCNCVWRLHLLRDLLALRGRHSLIDLLSLYLLDKLLVLALNYIDSYSVCALICRSIDLLAQHLSLEISLSKSLTLGSAIHTLLGVLLRLVLNDTVSLKHFWVSLSPFYSRLSSLNLLL